MADKFAIGDTVKAKGIEAPAMVVDSVHGGISYQCFWFFGKKRETARFHEDTLELAPVKGAAAPAAPAAPAPDDE